jgi:hypothetical protein
LLFFFLNFIALGGGTYFTGWLIDHLAQYGFTHPGAPDLVTSLQAMVTGHGPAASAANFATACPGGVAPKGSAPALAASCKTTLVAATRGGILVTIFFYAWAAFHYLLGSFGLAKELGRVAAARKAREA